MMDFEASKKTSGFTLIEVLVAMMILAVGILAVASMQEHSIRANAYAARVTDATTVAQDKMEELLSLNYGNAAALSIGTHTDQDAPPGYTVGWTVTQLTTNAKLIELTVDHDRLRDDGEITLKCVKPRVTG